MALEPLSEDSEQHQPWWRPLSAGETIATALRLYRADLARLWAAVAWVVIPLQALQLAITEITLPAHTVVRDGSLLLPSGNANAVLISEAVTALITQLVLMISVGAVYRLLFDDYAGRPTNLVTSFSFALDRVLSLFWISLLVGVATLLGVVVLVIPGIYLFVTLFVAVPVLMAEGRRGLGALSRSGQLVSGRWWATLGRVLLMIVLFAAIELIAGVVSGALSNGITQPFAFLAVSAAVTAVISILTVPLLAAVPIIVYIDLRVCKEGISHPDQLLA
jgi:hypothetical protein